MITHIKLYGERNTSSNYLSNLLQLNLDVTELRGVVPDVVSTLQRYLPGDESLRDLYFRLSETANLGWKHGRARDPQTLTKFPRVNQRLGFVTLTKNPYSWLLSLHRNPYSHRESVGTSFEDFVRSPWQPVSRDRIGRQSLPTPVDLWNIKNRSYLNLRTLATVNLTTEDLFVDAAGQISKIADRLQLNQRPPGFQDFVRSTKDPTKDGDYYRDYYLNELWRSDLSEDATSYISQRVDQELMAHFGYEVLP